LCGLCGAFGVASHWTDGQGGGQAARRHRARVANAVLGLYGLTLRDWANRFTLQSRTGKTAIVDHLGAVWPTAERLSGRLCDPLDSEVIAALERLAVPTA
jgi:hypothetical protein